MYNLWTNQQAKAKLFEMGLRFVQFVAYHYDIQWCLKVKQQSVFIFLFFLCSLSLKKINEGT